ncbi:PD-(D/E)XK nuclease family protein [Kitasatospora sp. MBT66]|uniref:RecB family exonuclease n=1 Tax=Kitasatospora sp. MBT66 TaxID=1444769 RepID=UPI001314DA60|nr:PD-(D/E)XK nuclease family protein [Kitasatospora sp. MBT66]
MDGIRRGNQGANIVAGHKSVSQLLAYSGCSERYYLERIRRAPQTPAGWTLQGLAVHETVEAWERSGRALDGRALRQIYNDTWQKHYARMLRDEPDVNRWLTGNIRVKGETDVQRRFDRGYDQVDFYISDALSAEWAIWETPDYDPAIELPFAIDLDGVEVIGYIDQIREWPDGSLEIVDVKTGSKTPDWDLQLGMYRLAIIEAYELAGPVSGSFFMLKDGKYVPAKNLEAYTRDRLTAWFKSLDRGVESQVYLPNPGSQCRICSVWKYCSAT